VAKQISKMEQITVRIERVKNTSDGFSVYTARKEGELMFPLTVKQFCGPVRSQQRWVLAGSEVQDPRWGTQFVAQFAALAAPRDARELDAFLTSNLIAGWDCWSYDHLRHLYGPDEIMEACQSPAMLAQIDGITPEMIASLQEAWRRGSGLAATFGQLAEWGCTSRQSETLVKYYGPDVVERLRENPYRDMLQIAYYGWKTADAIGRWFGMASDDPRRVIGGLETAIHETTWQAGHTWLYEGQAVAKACELLNLPQSTVQTQVDSAVADSQLIRFGDRIWPESLYVAERVIAAQIEARLSRPRPQAQEAALNMAVSSAHLASEEQLNAVVMALTDPISLLTGGPGTGKTTTLKTLIGAAHAMTIGVTLMAPTGKAAARMTEATGHPASTIHSRLKIVPGNAPKPDSMEPVTGLVIVDEISMLDSSLAAAMLSRISPTAQILLVGDPDQLPSVGPGAVLRDLLIADRTPRVHLDRVYRNDAGIAVNAARMRAGETILDLPDCEIIPSASPEMALEQVLAAVNNHRDALVLTPTNDGPCGRYALNALLQPILNPGMAGRGIRQYAGSAKDEDGTLQKREEELCLGDRVMVIRNHTELGVFNGQVGVVVDLMVPRSLDVEIDGEMITFAGEDRRLLTLAYAITGHKSQGSEAPTVIVPVFPSRVLSREWLYTVITRARERCYLIGDVSAMQSCIKVQRSQERRTGLVEAIARTA